MKTPPSRSRKARGSLAMGMYWAVRVSSIAMQMAVPAGLGYLADRRFGTAPWLVITGACFGGVLFAMEVHRLAHSEQKRSGNRRPRPPD